MGFIHDSARVPRSGLRRTWRLGARRLSLRAMDKPKLTYFDAHISRGEECRLALTLAGVDFDDVRLSREAWRAGKPSAPFGTMPFYEEPGKPALGKTNAILRLLGRRHGLYPKDDFTAAQHDELMAHVEDLRAHVGPLLHVGEAAERQKVREALATTYLPTWAAQAERHLDAGPFVSGEHANVVDLKLYMAVRWFKRGTVDHIPATIFDAFPKLTRLHDAVAQHPRLAAWIAAH